MKFERKCGILFHPTSLPGTDGIGTIGKKAYEFVDWLVDADMSLWQILPLGPTGYGDSPYASFSTFAGNQLLIDLDDLVERGWALKSDIKAPAYIKKDGDVDFGAVVWWKNPVLKTCASYFLKNASKEDKADYTDFCKKNNFWLDDFTLFRSIKDVYDAKAAEEKPASSMWHSWWPKELARHEEAALKDWKASHKEEIELIKVIQFFFQVQWNSLKEYANENGISIIGDIPIFVAPDSADVWANQKFFQLDENGKPLCVAGVPPDYFCATGQLWGNPLYDWDLMKKDGYKWWISRIARVLELTDCVRIDHFRGFEAYWSVGANEETAINGKWIKGPGIDLFKAIRKKLGDIPIIAEDLGVITDEVRDLRDTAQLPGMKVLQFAFSAGEIKENGMVNSFMPHQFESAQCVAYTGTHDNDTLQAWLELIDDDTLEIVGQYFAGEKLPLDKIKAGVKNGNLRRQMIRAAVASSAAWAVIPLQDVLGCTNEARMNRPATTGSNWTWRMKKGALKEKDAQWLSFLNAMYGR